MSAAFALDFSGDPVPCDYPRCILEAFHDGQHKFPEPKPGLQFHYDRHCVVCGRPFTILGANGQEVFSTCGSPECVLHFASHGTANAPLLCRCPQRPYPHELSVHEKLRLESPGTYAVYGDESIRFASPGMCWPWSLKLSPRVEMSTERKFA
jgi:hypothetical protein